MYVGDVEEDKRREMRGVGGPLLCISDLLSDVGEGDGGDPSSSLSISISNPNDHLPHLDLCQLFQVLFQSLFEVCVCLVPCSPLLEFIYLSILGLDIFRLPAFVVSGRASYRRLYLSGIGFGIEDFSTLHRRPETRKLGRAILTATKEHARPNNMYRALYLWCLETNTFVIGHGEAGISFWEMKQISRLSIQGEYNEETIPNFSELIESGDVRSSHRLLNKAAIQATEESRMLRKFSILITGSLVTVTGSSAVESPVAAHHCCVVLAPLLCHFRTFASLSNYVVVLAHYCSEAIIRKMYALAYKFTRYTKNFIPCLLYQEDYNQLNEALAGTDHSWTALTLKLCSVLETADKLVQSANSNIKLLLEKVGMIESIVRRGDSAIAAGKAIHSTLNKKGPSTGSQNNK
ncbi:hypothetical protein HHK36_009020 [Tetracentron sinense]|uniref:Uncharacterized protein n=1 Tax=Tetracentron sinense TaxID=13715 RepID=A0A834ZEM1_TETSI|nr:hypothetical protein HHK36_009020 [Tetracentron sinense]